MNSALGYKDGSGGERRFCKPSVESSKNIGSKRAKQDVANSYEAVIMVPIPYFSHSCGSRNAKSKFLPHGVPMPLFISSPLLPCRVDDLTQALDHISRMVPSLIFSSSFGISSS